MNRLPQGSRLEERARRLGVTLSGLVDPEAGIANEAELQRRVLEAERSKRESFLWLVAVISAAASVISALAAWAAVVGS